MSSRRTRLMSTSALAGVILFAAFTVARAADVVVSCDAGERLQPAINQARPGDTIVASGFCAENVVIPEEAARITLDGQGAATVDGPSAVDPVFTVLGRGITIRGFTITGGANGIAVWRGATAVIDGNMIEGGTRAGTGGQGINIAQHSYAQIVSNTIQLNSNAGITVIEGSYARIGVVIPTTPQGNVIRGNGPGGGVYVSRSAGARIGANNISENAGPGVRVDATSHAVVSANRIDGNGSHGVAVAQNSSVWLGADVGVLGAPNQTEVPNQGFGISCSLNSSAVGRLGTLTGATGAQESDGSCTENLAP
jgi:hypothetical protein